MQPIGATPLGAMQRPRPAARPCASQRAGASPRPTAAHARRGAAAQCSALSRREQLAAGGAVLLAPLALSAGGARAEEGGGAAAAATAGVVDVDVEDGFRLTVPSHWAAGEGQLPGSTSFQGASGARRTLAWYPPEGGDVNLSLTITNTSAEFTKLGSFGNVFTFGQNLVNSMDRSFLLRVRGSTPVGTAEEPVQVAKLLDARETRGMYYVEYTVEKQPGPKRHLYSLVALAYNGRYNRLYTLTGQCLEEQVDAAAPVLQAALKSFVPPARIA
ncbi:PPD3 [Scenedesmus sp. PABB004]|nr:PPD3 [Scenedesmus sp. PABB004]